MPDQNSLKAAFSALESEETRRSVCQLLLDQLCPDEWREVRAQARNRLKRDILGSIPVELVVEIVRYLDISDVFMFQRVSKHWKTLLSSPPVYSRLYSNLNPIQYSDGLPSRNDLSVQGQLEYFKRYTKQKARLGKGHPVSKAFYESPRLPDTSPFIDVYNYTGFDYFNGKCAWIDFDSERNGIIVRCLRSGTEQRFQTTNGECVVYEVRVSEAIVATLTSEDTKLYCHVWNHCTGESARFIVPPEKFSHFDVKGTKVAFCFGESALIWDFDSRLIRTVPIDDMVVFCALSSTSDNLITVHFRDTDPNSRYLHAKQARLIVVRHSLTPYNNDGDSHYNHGNPLDVSEPPQQVKSMKSMKLPLDQSPLQDSIATQVGLTYKHECWYNDRIGIMGLQVRIRHDDLDGPEPSHSVLVWHDPVYDDIFVHVDTWSNRRVAFVAPGLYYIVDGRLEAPVVFISKSRISNSTSISEIPRYPQRVFAGLKNTERGEPTNYVYGDSSFIMILGTSGLRVWCFDESCPPGFRLLKSKRGDKEDGGYP